MNPINNSAFMLEVSNLNKKFGVVHAVRNLNFQIRKGEIFGFLGPNGAGKSTTMRMVTSYIPPTSGSIKVDGQDIAMESLAARQKIGYLPEHNPLYNDMTILEYLAFVGEIRGLKGSKLQSRMDDMIAVCSLSKMAARQIGNLSKGYRQRVGLAQAMIHNPDLLILDEPMSGLDPNQIIEIRHLIKNLGQEKTVVYCSHILSEVSATCDRILIINDGNIVASGTPDELINKSGSGTKYHARVRGERYVVESKLASTPGVTGVSILNVSSDWVTAEIMTSQEDIGEAIFKTVVENGLSLAELKRESASLEDVFTKLTRG
jgi:ABC-2 type transport system ATP-binding protein